MLAIFLNRTVVLPKFFKHTFDPSYNKTKFSENIQNPEQRLDLEQLAKYVPVITFEEFSEVCQNGIDITFIANKWLQGGSNGGAYGQLRAYQDLSGVNFDSYKSREEWLRNPELSKKIVWPSDAKNKMLVKAGQLMLPANQGTVGFEYGRFIDEETDKCAFWLLPFRNMMWDKMLPHYTEYRTRTVGKRETKSFLYRKSKN